MKTMRSLLTATAVAVALTSCGGAAGGAEADVEKAFLAYNQALGAKDVATVCSFTSPERSAELVQALSSKGLAVTSCEEAFTKILAEPSAAASAAETLSSLRIDKVTVDGDTATIAWSAKAQGREQTRENGMRLIDGRWQLLSAKG